MTNNTVEQQLTTLKTSFNEDLEKRKQQFPAFMTSYTLAPEQKMETETTYINIDQEIKNKQNRLNYIKKNISEENDLYYSRIEQYTKDVETLKQENESLRKKHLSLVDLKEGAQGKYVDSKTIYKQIYLGNFILASAIVGLCIFYNKKN